jgi:hypothetical protein
MKFLWRDISGATSEIDNPQIISDLLQKLHARHATVLSAGKDKEAAILQSYWEDQHLQWRRCAAQFYCDQETFIAALIQQATERAEWWAEWFNVTCRHEVPSQCQLRLLGDIPADIMPKTWSQAANALYYMPAYRPPDQDVASKGIGLNAALIEIAGIVRISARQLKESFAKGIPSQEELSNHHLKVKQLEKAITDVEALL